MYIYIDTNVGVGKFSKRYDNQKLETSLPLDKTIFFRFLLNIFVRYS